jgi:gliding motility-associated protein GldL
MGKYRRYKNRMEMFLASNKGKRVLNFFYSWGASIVILGALFKILHLPYGDLMLAVGMITEFFVFFVFGFEKPATDYQWEDVFPVLKTKNPMDRPDAEHIKVASMIDSADNIEDDDTSRPNNLGGVNFGGATTGNAVRSNNSVAASGVSNGAVFVGGGGSGLSEEDANALSESIKKLGNAAEQIANMTELTEATQKYMEQMAAMSEKMAHFNNATSSLADVSSGINQHSRNYIEQMEFLNRNISGLNTIYEIQLKGVSSQIDTIGHINGGLNRIKELYDGSIVDSSVFRNETEKMAQQLAQLNQVYARLLQAMTVNMYGAAPIPGAYQQQHPYPGTPEAGMK